MCIALKKIIFRNRAFSLTLVLLLILAIVPIGAFANIGDGYDETDEIVTQIGDGENGEDGDYAAGNEQGGDTGEKQDGDAGNEQGGDNDDGDDDIIVDEIEDEIPEKSEPYRQTLEATVYAGEGLYYLSEANERIKLTGCFPEDACAVAFPVELSLDLGTVVAAYDIAVYDAEGELFEPESAVTVELELENMPELEEDSLVVVRVPSGGAYKVLNTELYVSAYGFEFEADYLSVLAVVDTIDQSAEDEEEIIDETEDENDDENEDENDDEINSDLIEEEEDIGEEEVIEEDVAGQPYYQDLIANVYKDKGSAENRGSLDTSGAQITVSGVFPDLAYVIAYPVELEIETGEGEDDVEVIAAYDITIYSESGEVIQPDDTVAVSIILPELEGMDEEITVYHVPDDGSEPVAMETHVTDDRVEFETSHFSTYAVTIGTSSSGATFTYTVNGGSSVTVSMSGSASSGYTANLPIDSPDSTLTINGFSGTTSTNVTIISVSLNSNSQNLTGTYTVSPGDTLVITYTRGTGSTVYTLTLSITSKSFSYTHIDVKTAAATDDTSSPLTVTALNYVEYTYNNATIRLASDKFTKSNAEWTLNSKTLNLTQDVVIEISVDLSNGDTIVSEIDMNDVYNPGTKYKATNDGASKIGTYFGISADSEGYYDISGKSIFLISTLTCNGLSTSSVSLGSISTSSGGGGGGGQSNIGLDLVLSTKTLIDTSYSLGLIGTKKLYGENSEEIAIGNGQFTFVLTETNPDWTEVTGDDAYTDTISCDRDGKIVFKTIDYKELTVPNTGVSHTYKYYTVTEVNGGETGYEYSEWLYYVTVKIKVDNQGNTEADVTYECKTSNSDAVEPSDSIVFKNYHNTGTLEISKVVTGANVPTDKEYEIEVKIDDNAYSGEYYIRFPGENAGTMLDSTRDGKIPVKDGETIVIKGLAYGTTYSVTETDNGGATSVYYTVVYDDGGDTNNDVATGIITPEDTLAEVVVTNLFGTNGNSFGLSVTVEKVWEDSNNTNRPTSIKATLQVKNASDEWVDVANHIYGTNPATLNASNQWTYRWDGLPDGTYRVIEKDEDVPSGYIVAYPDAIISPTIQLNSDKYTPNNNLEIQFNLDFFILIKKGGSYGIWTPLKLSSEQETLMKNDSSIKKEIGNKEVTFYYGYGSFSFDSGTFTIDKDKGTITFKDKSDWSLLWGGVYNASQISKITNTFNGHDITIKKVAGDGTTVLSGAEFKLYKYSATSTESDKYDELTSVDLTALEAGGTVTLSGIPAGRYKIVETAAPLGYKGLSDPVYFTIDTGGNVILTDASGETTNVTYTDVKPTGNTLTITNHAYVELPETGGNGLLGFTMFGFTVIFGGASALLIIQKAYSKKRRAFHKINGAGSGD